MDRVDKGSLRWGMVLHPPPRATVPKDSFLTYLPHPFLRTMWDKTKGRFVPHGTPPNLNSRDVAELIQSKINKIFVM